MKQKRNFSGVTLIEVMVAILIIAIGVLGAANFRYYCVTDAKKADVQINAARIASMLLEDWKAVGGITSYNPADTNPNNGDLTQFPSQFTISNTSSPPAPAWRLATKLASYEIKDLNNNIVYYIIIF